MEKDRAAGRGERHHRCDLMDMEGHQGCCSRWGCRQLLGRGASAANNAAGRPLGEDVRRWSQETSPWRPPQTSTGTTNANGHKESCFRIRRNITVATRPFGASFDKSMQTAMPDVVADKAARMAMEGVTFSDEAVRCYYHEWLCKQPCRRRDVPCYEAWLRLLRQQTGRLQLHPWVRRPWLQLRADRPLWQNEKTR